MQCFVEDELLGASPEVVDKYLVLVEYYSSREPVEANNLFDE